MRHQPGFSLLEIMLSLFILSVSMFLLSELQVRSMARVMSGREDIDRVYLVKKYLYRQMLEPEQARRQARTFDDPQMSLVVEPEAIPKKSSLAPFSKYLQFLRAAGTWERGTSRRELAMVTIAPRPPEKEGA